MKNYNIAVIPGDGIGPEVIAEGIKELRRINMEFNARYVRGMDGPDRGGCMMN